MKRKLTLFLLVLLAASVLFALPARAECGTESNPSSSFMCSAPAPPSPDFSDLALSLVADMLAIIP
jgi:hypothetical protein